MIDFIQKAFELRLGFEPIKPQVIPKMVNLSIGGNKKTARLVEFLYSDSSDEIRLDRKFRNAFDSRILSSDQHRAKYVSVVQIDDNGVEKFYESVKQAELDGFRRNTIRKCCLKSTHSCKGFHCRYATPEDITKYSVLTK
jgi:hypothetical protein